MKKTILIAATGILAGLILTGCCQKCRKNREAATRPIQGTVWHLVQFDGQAVDAPDKYELTFLPDGRIAGIGECNRFFGPYQVLNPNGSIKIGPVASTMMACLDPNIESQFFQMFEKVHLYQLDDKNLYLFVDNKIKAVFEPSGKPVEEDASVSNPAEDTLQP